MDEQYDTDFPALPKDKNPTKWGPVQATRASSRVAGDKRTIIEKAKQLKEVQNLEVHKPLGMKHKSFSYFNDPSFNTIASKIGVDINSLNDDSGTSAPYAADISQDRTVGSVPGNILTNSNPSIDCSDSPAESNEGLWSLICKHRRGKHPRNKSSP